MYEHLAPGIADTLEGVLLGTSPPRHGAEVLLTIDSCDDAGGEPGRVSRRREHAGAAVIDHRADESDVGRSPRNAAEAGFDRTAGRPSLSLVEQHDIRGLERREWIGQRANEPGGASSDGLELPPAEAVTHHEQREPGKALGHVERERGILLPTQAADPHCNRRVDGQTEPPPCARAGQRDQPGRTAFASAPLGITVMRFHGMPKLSWSVVAACGTSATTWRVRDRSRRVRRRFTGVDDQYNGSPMFR